MARKNSFRFEIPTFAYPGGKARTASRLVARMPRSGKVWCEPFAGRANVFWRARASGFKFERWVLNDPTTALFLESILDLGLREHLPHAVTLEYAKDCIKRAASNNDPLASLMSARLGYSGGFANGGSTGRAQINRWNRGGRARYITTLRCARRLLMASPPTEIHRDDGMKWIRNSKRGWFMYVDPPYLGCDDRLYTRCDGQEEWHRVLLKELQKAASRKVRWQLSGYRTDLYVNVLGEPSWEYEDYCYSARNTSDGHRARVQECVWER